MLMVTELLDYSDFHFFLYSCSCFSNFLQLVRIIYIQGKIHYCRTKRKEECWNVVPHLQPNNDLGSIFFSRMDGRPCCI